MNEEPLQTPYIPTFTSRVTHTIRREALIQREHLFKTELLQLYFVFWIIFTGPHFVF